MRRYRDRYGTKPGKLGSLIGLVITVIVLGFVFGGLYYALANWPFTVLWVVLMVVLGFGALFGGLPTVIGDLWFAWFVRHDEGLEDEDS